MQQSVQRLQTMSVCLEKQLYISYFYSGRPSANVQVGPSNAFATADGLDLEANRAELLRVDEETTVKYESRLVHACIHGIPVNLLELLPFSGDDDSLSTLASLEGRWADCHLLLD